MTPNGWAQIALFSLVVMVVTKPLGQFLFSVFEKEHPPLPAISGPIERITYRLLGVDPKREQLWTEYTFSLLAFSAMGMLVTYGIERLQAVLPLNPQKFIAVEPYLAFNTAASFVTNTNWQSYSGEAVMSNLTQMAGLAWHNFTSAASGIAVALAVARGFTRRPGPEGARTLGNFWVDMVRSTLFVLLPLCVLYAVVLISQGVVQTFATFPEVTTLEGLRQVIAVGPVASQEAIKMLGTNGGGFFNANSAHPFENPNPFTNFLQMVSIFTIPAALTYTYGKMARDTRQGWALFAAMGAMFLVGVTACYWAESHPNSATHGMAVTTDGNLEGKETRFGVANSALFATVTTDASCGAVNAMHDSFTPLGGLVPLVNIQLGEVIFGGVGAGLYGILVMVLLSVFIAGLMVGRTPEYLGKKIEAKEMKLAMLYALVFPMIILGFTAWSAVTQDGLKGLNNAGPHGLSEILYAYSSAAGNNGSAFAGLTATSPWWNTTLAFTMLGGRFLMIIPAMAIAGSMIGKKTVAPGPGTFPTNGPIFVALLVCVVVIVGALTFFPALALSPIAEHFVAYHAKFY